MSCLFVVTCLLALIVAEGHDVSRPSIAMHTFRAIMIPLVTLLLLLPPAWVMSAMCTFCAVLFGAIGFYSGVTDSVGLTVASVVMTNVAMHLVGFMSETTSRISFVHQLSAVRYAEAATHQSEVTRRSETAASRAINHCAKRVMYDNIDWTDQIREKIVPA